MHAQVKSYLYFLAFSAITAIVVRPVVKSLNVPLLTQIVGE
jgi:hypothetical protein